MIDDLLSRLENVKPRGKGKWMACCPAHDDKTPSLALSVDHNGLILIKCFAGCETLDILAAVNMQMEDLFPDDHRGEFKGLQRLQDEYDLKKGNKVLKSLSEDVMVLRMAKQMRERGERLSRADMERELRAFKKVRETCKK